MKIVLLAAAALLVPAVAHANPRCKVSTAPADAFKDVTGAKADDGTVSAITRPEGDLIVGVWSAGKHHHATAAYVYVKNGERCSGPIVELGDGAKLEGLADLDAASPLYDGAWKLLALDAKPSHGAAVVTATKHGETDVVLLAVPPDQRQILRAAMKDVAKIETSGSGTPRDLVITSGSKTRTLHWKSGAYAEK